MDNLEDAVRHLLEVLKKTKMNGFAVLCTSQELDQAYRRVESLLPENR